MSHTLGHTLGATQTPPRKASDVATQPHVFVALECDRPLAMSTRHALGDVAEVGIGRGRERTSERINIAGARGLNLRVPDRWMSSAHAKLTQSFGRWVLEDLESKNGTVVNGVAAARHTLQDGDVFECGHTLFLYRDAIALRDDEPRDVDVGSAASGTPGLLTLVPEFARDLDKLRQLAPANVSILLLGESGTGKEVIARALHELSRRPGELVGVNCGAIPDSLIESELFGHKKGAFSGAVADSPGLVRGAHEGTLFLDEIADLPPASQAAFLRVLQEREVRPVGSTRSYPVDIRLISATHQDLLAKVESGAFRNDLFARIAGYRVTLPPLRDRVEDLGFLIGMLLRRVAGERADAVEIDCEGARALFRYRWPLNIRELETALQTSVVLAGDGPIALEHLPEPVRERTAGTPANAAAAGSTPPVLTGEQQQHRDELVALFRQHQGNVSAVARATGKDRKQIQRWIKRYELDPESYR
jgi:DNA-binding NtrC family response regulator